jgi:hypothetical protein
VTADVDAHLVDRASVRATGHDWAGRAVRDGGLVIDVSGMRDITH